MICALQKLLREHVGELHFSCSIGLAFADSRYVEFQELFNRADRALYRAKAAGKNQCVCYRDDMGNGRIGSPEENPGRRTEIESNQIEQWALSRLVSKSFEILYEATDFPQAVQSILALVGETFGASRVYVFESKDTGDFCSNTFEWCNEGVAPQKDQLQNHPYLIEGRDYRDNFDENGIFYCQNVDKLTGWERQLLESQGILSTLQCAIQGSGVFHGFVGLDDCKVHRMWTKEQIDALTFEGKLLAVFLMKNRAQEKLSSSLSNLYSVLDHQEAYLYVLNPDNYQLRYINRKTKEAVPEAEPDRICYEVFYHRNEPCANCAMKKARETGTGTVEVYNPFLNIWVLSDASMVKWDREKACLVACRDITAYKTENKLAGTAGGNDADSLHA